MRGAFAWLGDLVLRPWYRWSGLDRLVAEFASPDPPSEPLLTQETIRLNHIKWRGVVALGLSDRGLYLRVAASPPALIPWGEVADRGAEWLYGRAAHALDLGAAEPVSLVVYEDLYHHIAPWLA